MLIVVQELQNGFLGFRFAAQKSDHPVDSVRQDVFEDPSLNFILFWIKQNGIGFYWSLTKFGTMLAFDRDLNIQALFLLLSQVLATLDHILPPKLLFS